MPVVVRGGRSALEVCALVDSGAVGNFIAATLAQQLRLSLQKLAFPLTVLGVTGERMQGGTLGHRTLPFPLQVGVLHQEVSVFYVLPKAKDPLILRLPWLCRHNPQFNWRTGELTACSRGCLSTCMPVLCKATGIESPKPENLDLIPEEYQDFRDMFSTEHAFQLPPHRDCDCAIELPEGARLPRGMLYPVSIEEEASLEGYI